MEKEEIEKIAMLVAIQKTIEKEINNFKEKCRLATQEEIDKINEGNLLDIKRENKPITTRGEEYAKLEKELKAKYPTITTYEENGKITLKATHFTTSKVEIIYQNILTQNKTTLKEMARLAK